jgi:uncharacterized protein YciI
MPQFLVLAYDGHDAEAPARRQAARPAHLERVRPLVESGQLLIGGAFTDEDGTPRGSALIADFPSRKDVEAWIAGDPYVTGNVWQRTEVRPFRVAVASGFTA